jgi:aryl-alcohol dehydrogenase-like predicted oxidoreductase
VDRSLAELRTGYLDLYLVHWPVPHRHVLAYKHLEELQREGKIRSIGGARTFTRQVSGADMLRERDDALAAVSNYTVEDYEELMAHAVCPSNRCPSFVSAALTEIHPRHPAVSILESVHID